MPTATSPTVASSCRNQQIINHAHRCSERLNLTVRQSVAALVRRTWATAQEAPHLRLHLNWWCAYSHVVRPHASLRVALAQEQERGGQRIPHRYRQRTPAMAAGVTTRRWTVQDVLALPLPPAPADSA